MSAISDLYDALDNALGGLFAAPTYKKLVNPYSVELNDALSLARGWGFKIGPKSLQKLSMGRYAQFEAEIQVVQTIAQRGTDRDITIRQNAEKVLLEDQFLLLDYLQTTTIVGDKTWLIEFVADGGIEFVFTEQQNYFTITTGLRAVISEGC